MSTPLAPGFRYSGTAQHRLSYNEVKRLAQAYGLPGDAIAQIAKGESGLYADVQQRDPGDRMVGYGLLQMTPNAWGKNSAAYKHMQSLGGIAAMRDPVKNMAMARFLYKAAGNKLTPWYGTRYLTNRSGEGTLGPVDLSRTLGGAGSSRTSLGAGTTPPSGMTGQRTTQTVPGQSFAPERAAAAATFLGSGRNDSQNNLDFAMQIRGLQDAPSRTVQSPATSGTTRTSGAGTSPGSIVERANALDSQHLPYKWGGGHGAQPVDPHDAVPVDCSGAVSSVLGINPRVSGEFTKWGKAGDGGNQGVTVAANGHHVIMKINGHWFGTSRSNPGGGAGWIPQAQVSPQYLKGFTLRHLG